MNTNDIVILDAIIAKKKKESEELKKQLQECSTQIYLLHTEIEVIEKLRKERFESIPSGVIPDENWIPTSAHLINEMLPSEPLFIPKISMTSRHSTSKLNPDTETIRKISEDTGKRIIKPIKRTLISRVMEFIDDAGECGRTMYEIQEFVFFTRPWNAGKKYNAYEHRGLYCDALYHRGMLKQWCTSKPVKNGTRLEIRYVYNGPLDIVNTKFFSKTHKK